MEDEFQQSEATAVVMQADRIFLQGRAIEHRSTLEKAEQ